MADDVIDLTNDDDSPPSSPPLPPQPNKSFKTTRVLRFTASISSNKIQFKIKKLSSLSSRGTHKNPTSNHNQPRDPSLETIEFSQINMISDLQPIGHGDQSQTPAQARHQAEAFSVYEPHLAFLLSQGPKLKEPWTVEEHEQFLMGLVKYGKGRWSKIARHFVRNKTAKEVQSYATSFFKYITATCLHTLRKKNSSSIITFKTFEEFMANSSGYVSASEENFNAEPPQALMLFPDGGEGSSSTGMNNSMATSGGDEVDLELRLA